MNYSGWLGAAPFSLNWANPKEAGTPPAQNHVPHKRPGFLQRGPHLSFAAAKTDLPDHWRSFQTDKGLPNV
ncbi:hypothetical protein GCM10007921_42690 [Tritonibacter mobilis]|nr:hypothetical protein GCM10007921_42690 [Tritonibacter mobilis]